ncbi:MAG: ATP-binding protein [Bacteroidota bacterium]
MKIFRFALFTLLLFSLTNASTYSQVTSMTAAHQAYVQALQARSMHQIIRALMLTGDAYKKNSIDSAYKTYAFALKLSDRFGLAKFRPQLFFELAMLHCRGFNFAPAVILFDSSKNAALRQGDFAVVSNVLNMLGGLQLDLWSTREARILFDSAYALAMRHHLYLQAGVALGNLAGFINDQDSATTMWKNAVSLMTKDGKVKPEAGYIYINIGNGMSNPDSAISYYEKGLQIGYELPVPEIIMGAYNNMAYSYLDKNNPGKASEFLQKKAIPVAIADSNYDWLSTLYDTWSDVMANKHNEPEAIRLEKESRKALVEAEKRKSSNQVRLLIMLLEVKNKDLLLSASQLKVTSQEDSIRNLKFMILAMIAIAAMIVLGALGVYQKMKIRGQRKELQLIRGQIEIEDHERKRIAMQLHDLVGPLDQKMVGQIERFTPADPAMRSSLIQEWKKSSSVIHALSYHLNQAMVEDLPFRTMVEGIVEEYRQLSKLTLTLVMSPGIDFHPKHQFHLSCIIRELLTNAMKYVGQGNVTLTLTTEHGNHYVIYQDYGPGFDREKIDHQSMGINNIFERATLMGGLATLNTAPGKGTKWIIAIPD